MQVTPYLSFNGNCEAAFTFYEQCLGGTLGTIFRYAGTPMASGVPEDWSAKVMHTTLTVGDQELSGADAMPGSYEASKGFSLLLNMKNTDEAERIFNALSKDGQILMPLQETFWAARFGSVIDRFGIPWSINCEGSEQPAV